MSRIFVTSRPETSVHGHAGHTPTSRSPTAPVHPARSWVAIRQFICENCLEGYGGSWPEDCGPVAGRGRHLYIRSDGEEFVLVRTVAGPDGHPHEVVLCSLGQDPELNLYFAIERGRHENPELWEGVEDFHALQALENHKRRVGGFKPSLVVFRGRREPDKESVDEQ